MNNYVMDILTSLITERQEEDFTEEKDWYIYFTTNQNKFQFGQ